jgi:hypothetical protein
MSQLEQLESIQAKFMEKINLLMDCKHNMQVCVSEYNPQPMQVNSL